MSRSGEGLHRLAVAAVEPAEDARQSATALLIARGTCRYLRALGMTPLRELALPSGRRADLVGLNAKGEVWIIEIKSSLADLRADNKWEDYRFYCDRLFFAFTQDMPPDVFPDSTGLIIADAYSGHVLREAPEHRLSAATRKQVTQLIARTSASRLDRLIDPGGYTNCREFD